MRDHAKELRHLLADVHRVVRALGLEKGAQRQATGLTICCPWHDENTPSCSVTLGKDGTIRLRCFGCQATGDVFALIAQVHGLDVRHDFPEVLRISAELANATDILDDLDAARRGAPAPKRAPWVAPVRPAPIEVQRQSIEVYDAIVSRLLKHCPLDGEVARYLDGRGLLSLASSAGLGALPPYAEQKPIFASMVAEFGLDDLDAAGLVYGHAFSVPGARLLIPWRTPDGRIDVLQRRRIDDREPKYTVPKGRPIAHPFGSEVPFPEDDPENDGRGTTAIAYVEGALDVLALREIVRLERRDVFVLGLPGVTSFQLPWAQQAQGRVAYVALDADAPGENKVKELGAHLKRAGAVGVKRWKPSGDAKDWAAALAVTARKGTE